MEMIINSSYLITIGTLIGYERKMKCKELAGTKEKEAYKQIPFCEGVCCVQTYRNIEKATLEVKTPIYEELLHKLGYEMNYDDALYKEINYRLQNLNDAIEKYDLESVFLIVDKLNSLLRDSEKDIYQKYLIRIIDVIYQYYKSNEFPDIDKVEMMKQVYVGYPNYFRDIIIDIIFKYGLLNIIDDKEFDLLVESLNLGNNNYIPNRINELQFLSYSLDLTNFYDKSEELMVILNQKGIYIRILDIYDLKTYADFYANPMEIDKDIDICQENVRKLLKKLKINEDLIVNENIPKMIKKKLSQHYYHIGYVLYMQKNYQNASIHFEKAINYDDIFDILCKNLLFSCYDRLKLSEEKYAPYLSINKTYDNMNKNYIVFKYYAFKYNNKDSRARLKYLKKNVLDFILPEDQVLKKVLFFEINCLAKDTSNYQILQEYIEKMGIVD